MKQFWFLLTAVGLVSSGCASLEDFKYRAAQRGRAEEAWKQAQACMRKECVNHDYAYGFREGYTAVCTGQGTCPPVVPPPKYYHSRYQSTEGQCHVSQWYAGYQAGAIAADRHGRSLWTEVPTPDGPGCKGPCNVMTTDAYSTSVIEVPMDSGTPIIK
jgi:hypothetical protein